MLLLLISLVIYLSSSFNSFLALDKEQPSKLAIHSINAPSRLKSKVKGAVIVSSATTKGVHTINLILFNTVQKMLILKFVPMLFITYRLPGFEADCKANLLVYKSYLIVLSILILNIIYVIFQIASNLKPQNLWNRI